jgi:hypothetical protein
MGVGPGALAAVSALPRFSLQQPAQRIRILLLGHSARQYDYAFSASLCNHNGGCPSGISRSRLDFDSGPHPHDLDINLTIACFLFSPRESPAFNRRTRSSSASVTRIPGCRAIGTAQFTVAVKWACHQASGVRTYPSTQGLEGPQRS